MLKKSEQPTVYSSISPLKNPLGLITSQIRDLKKAFYIGTRILYRDITSIYRKSVFGYFWAFIPYLLQAGIFIFLNKANILNIRSKEVPYTFFVLIGVTFWFLFKEITSAPLKEFESNRTLLAKLNFPPEAIVISGIGRVLFNFFLKVILLICLLLVFDIQIKSTLPLVIIPVFALLNVGLVIGIIIVPFGVLFKDIQQGLSILTIILMYLSPVVYPLPEDGILSHLMLYNPITYIIESIRELIYIGTMNYLPLMIIFCLSSIIMLWLVLIFYRISIPIVIERMEA